MPNERKLERTRRHDPDLVEVVWLGEQEYEVIPQRIGYLRTKLGMALGDLGNLQLETDNILDVLGSRVYAVLNVFIPDLMPEWEFHGFPTKEAWEGDDYNEEYDKSPDPPQLRKAFSAASRVNEVELLKHLGKLIGPETIRGMLAGMVADSMEARRRTRDLENTSVTPGPDTPSTPSGTTHLTSVE